MGFPKPNKWSDFATCPKWGLGICFSSCARRKVSFWISGCTATSSIASPHHGLSLYPLWIGHSGVSHSPILGQRHCFKRDIYKSGFKAQSAFGFLWRCSPTCDKMSNRKDAVFFLQTSWFSGQEVSGTADSCYGLVTRPFFTKTGLSIPFWDGWFGRSTFFMKEFTQVLALVVYH